VFLEHLIWTLAIAILASLAYPRIRGPYVWVMVAGACIPDLDGIIDLVRTPPDFSTGLLPSMAEHTRIFHNLAVLALFALLAGLLLTRYRLEFSISALVAGGGFAAHLLEDILVYNPAAAVFWPLSPEMVGIGIVPGYGRDLLGIAHTQVFLLGILLVVLADVASIVMERRHWTLWEDL